MPLHCALAATQCIIIGHVCIFVDGCGCLFVGCCHVKSKLCSSTMTHSVFVSSQGFFHYLYCMQKLIWISAFKYFSCRSKFKRLKRTFFLTCTILSDFKVVSESLFTLMLPNNYPMFPNSYLQQVSLSSYFIRHAEEEKQHIIIVACLALW